MGTQNNIIPAAKQIMPEPIDVKRELEKVNKYSKRFKNTNYFKETENGFQSSFFDPLTDVENIYGNLRTADRTMNREIDCQTLRRVSKKAWVINLCITHVQKKIKPFLKPSTNRNLRGYVVKKVGEDVIKAAGKQSKERKAIEQFLKNTGLEKNSDRDNFVKFCNKIVRDALEIDQVATEIGFTKAGKPYAFWAVDGATVEKVLPGQDNPYNIKYVQVINAIPQAFYPEGTLIFDYQNPRTDVDFSFYGYSNVEQAIDLITSSINAFAYNAGFFTENKLPRGMLLIDGNASQETVEQMEDYIADIMSGSVSNQWRVPILTSGNGKSGESNSIKWVSLNGTNREMEFQGWLDFLISAIVSLFGCSMEELGLHSSKSQPVFERNTAPEIEASKSLVLGDMLAFLQQYINQIIEKVFPGYEIEFVGYERDDPKQILDITKGEVESFKTLNEVRQEKGLPKIEAEWADKCPANPQFVQMFQSAQMGGGDAMEDPDAADDEDGEETDGSGESGGDDEDSMTDSEAWGEVKYEHGADNAPESDSGDETENADEPQEDNSNGNMQKSFFFQF